MRQRPPECPKCGKPMETGFLLEHTRHSVGPDEWVEGQPVKSFWLGVKLHGRRRAPLSAYRCPECGYVELYAPMIAEQA